jgi:hypothetical protein
MKKTQKPKGPRDVGRYTLRNTETGWYRHAEGGHDTDEPDQAVVLDKAEANKWLKTLRDYEVIPLSDALPI